MNQTDTRFAVGREGLTFVTGLEKENHLDVNWRNGHCKAEVSFSTTEATSVPHLGEFMCQDIEQ
jgi:outer membrane usher protein FimD/PapC